MGPLVALGTAMLWAIAATLFRKIGPAFTPFSLNLWKGLITLILIAILYLVGLTQTANVTGHSLVLLLLSGAIGIGLGDTFFFMALHRLAERQTLLIAETGAPIFTALLAMTFLAEWLSPLQWLAIAIVLFSVYLVIHAEAKSTPGQPLDTKGLLAAIGAAICQSVGMILSRDVMATGQVDPFAGSAIRLVGGLVLVVLIIYFHDGQFCPKEGLKSVFPLLFTATFLGTFLALGGQMLALKLSPAAIVQTLLATCVIFAFLMAWIRGEKVHRVSWLGAGVSVVGVALLVAT